MGQLGYERGAYEHRDAGYSPDSVRSEALAVLDKLDWGGGKVLDVGSGGGGWIKMLHNRFGSSLSDITSVDLVDDGASKIDGVSFVIADCSSDPLPAQSRSVDLVSAVEVIEHLANPRHFIAEAARVLAPGGWLLITTPNNESLRARLWFLVRGYFPYFDDVGYHAAGHITPVTTLEISRMATEQGLQLELAQGVTPGLIPGLGRPWPSALYRRSSILFSDGLVFLLQQGKPADTDLIQRSTGSTA